MIPTMRTYSTRVVSKPPMLALPPTLTSPVFGATRPQKGAESLLSKLTKTTLLHFFPHVGHKVTAIIDADTFVMWNGEKIRLHGIDAPERTQKLGKEAQQHLSKLILGKKVSLIRKRKDRDRITAIVSVKRGFFFFKKTVDVSREMVRAGLAYDVEKYSEGAYKADENYARSQQLGVWQHSKQGGERPWDFRNPAR